MTTEGLSSPTKVESADTNTTKERLLKRLQESKEYRHAFVDEAIRTRITAQLKTMREQRNWDYKQLAEEIGKKVSWVYRLEDPNETPPTIPTLLGVAEAFDVGLDVRFCSFSELLGDVMTLDPDSFRVPSFREDMEKGSFSKGRRGIKVRVRCRRRRQGEARSKAVSRHRNHIGDAGICASMPNALALVA